MSKISTYEVVPIPKLADRLIGTSVGGEIEDLTYNFTLGELLNLFIPNIPANTLQGVLDYGNTATQDIILSGTIFTTNLEVTDSATILNSYLTEEVHITGGLYDFSDSIGTAGQVLRSTGTSVEWYTIPTIIPTLQQVLQSGNTSDISIVLTANITASTATAANVVSNTNLSVGGTLRDGTAAAGGTGQVLSSIGSGVRWVDMPVYTATSPLSINSVTRVISIQKASSTQDGYLSSADWITFDGKQDGILLTTLGSSGASTLIGSTLNVPNYTLAGLGGVPQTRTLTINGITYNLSADRSWTIPAGVASVSATTPLSSTGGADPVISIQESSSSLDGYLSSSDWLTFNNKQDALSLTTTGTSGPATLISNVLNIPQYTDAFVGTVTSVAALTLGTTGTDLSSTVANSTTTPVITLNVPTASAVNRGALSAADWTTFNNKQVAGNYITSLTGEATATGPGAAAITLDNTAVIGKVLTGLNVTGGTVTSTDNILSAFGKVQNQINGLIGGSIFQGTWDASTNTPTLTSGVGTNGYYYIVSVAGTTNLDGITDWQIGDWAIFAGTTWEKVDNTDAVSSVNGYTGTISLVTGDVLEGAGTLPGRPSQLYFTNARSRDAISLTTLGTGGASTYDSGTGVFNIPNYTTDLSGYVTLATDQTITGLKTILRGGDVLNFKIDTDTLYGLKVAYNQNELVPSGEATWSFVNTFNRDGSGFSVTPLSFFRGVLVIGERLLSASVNANLLDYYGNNPSGRYPVYAYNTGVQQFADKILVGFNTGVVNALTGAITDLPSGVVANFNGRVIGSNAVNSNEFATLSQLTGGTVTSVGLSMPPAFTVSNSPVTSAGTLTVVGAGNATQYVRGDGALATLPTSGTGGGASVSYYLNGSVNQGTIGGVTYYEMNRTPIIGTGTDFTRNTNGYIASFLTDAGDPALLAIPAGNWNFETYFNASSGGGSPTFYLELYKYDGTTFTLIASNSGSPKLINDGTSIEAYFSALAVPQTTLTLTDRLAIRIYVTTSGRTITLHTENGHLCQVITTFTTGLTALNGLTSQVQYFATGTSGTDFNILSAVDTHTFNLPTASAVNRGALSSADWTTFNNKQNAGNYVTTDTIQSISAQKFFATNTLTLSTTPFGSVNNTIITNSSGVSTYQGGTNFFGFNTDNHIYFSKSSLSGGNTGIFAWSNTIIRTYTLKDASGTLAFTSDIPANAITGTGTTNVVPKFTGTSTIGDSAISDNTNEVSITKRLFLNTGGQSILLTPNLGGSVNRIESSNLPLEIITLGSSLRLSAGGASTQVTLTSTGNFLIGTTTDSGLRLDVNGAAIIRSNLTVTATNATGDFATIDGSNTIRRRTAAQVLTDIGAQGALTNPVTGTGTTNYLAKFTGSTTVGNSQVFDNGTNVSIGGTSTNGKLTIISNPPSWNNFANAQLRLGATISGNAISMLFTDGNNSNGWFGYQDSSTAANRYFYWSANDGSSQQMILTNSGNLGLGVTPSAASLPTFENQYGFLSGQSEVNLTTNAYFNSGFKFIGGSNFALRYHQSGFNGSHQWLVATGGTAGNAISFTQAMTLTSGGNLLVGTTTDAGDRLNVNGSIRVPSTFFFRYDGDVGLIGSGSSIVGGTSSQLGIRAANDILFATNGSSERMRITSGGNVLIGTTTDSGFKLDVNGRSRFVGSTGLPNTSGTSQNGTLRLQVAGYGTVLDFGAEGPGTGKQWIQVTDASNLAITYPLLLNPNGGNVGIGTASPDGRFKVVGLSGAQIIVDLNGTNHNYFDADTTIFRSYGGGGFPERMRITSVGNTQPGADNAYSLGVSGTRWSAVWAANGTIQTSDEREKKDIVDSDLGLDLITKLRPVSFKWKVGQNVVTSQVVKDEEGNPILDEEGNEKTESVLIPREGKRTHYGLIAQEVEEVLDGKDFGGFIHDEETDIKGLRYDQFVPLLIKAIQEQQIQIDSLKNQIK